MSNAQPPGAPPPGGRAPPPPPIRIRAAPARPEIAPTPGTPRPAPSVGLPLPGAAAARAQPPPPRAGNQPLVIEPLAAEGSDASILVEWRAVQLGAQRSLGCTVRVPTGHALSLLVEQGIYRKALSASDVLELAAIPVAAAGTEGRITLRDDTSGATAQYAWLWQAPGGNQRPRNFNLPPPAARSGAAGAVGGGQTERAGEPRPATRGIAASEAKAAGAATAFFGQPALGRRVAFILDMSGSMMGSRWETCVRELAAALQALSTDSEFFLVLFSDRLVEPPGRQSRPRAGPCRRPHSSACMPSRRAPMRCIS
jgi:hypothetical protein